MEFFNRNRKVFFKQFVFGAITSLLMLVALLAVVSALQVPETLRLYTVLSGSMEPAIGVGSVVVVRPAENYRPGDIITFSHPQKPSVTTTTHRIRSVSKEGFITRGDVNDSADAALVRKTNVLGRVILTLPLLGYPVAFAKTLPGLIVLIIIPAILIIYNESQVIYKELRKGWQKWRR